MKLFFCFLFFVLTNSSYAANSGKFAAPPLTGPVIDEVGIMDDDHRAFLESNLKRLYQTDKIQIQVYITKSLNGLPIEDASIQITDQWKLGTEKEDRGALLLVAPNERRVRFEVGQGLEGDVPDVIAKRIIDQVMTPRFRQGDMSLGITAGVVEFVKYADPNFKFQDSPDFRQDENLQGRLRHDYRLLLIILIIFLFLRPWRRRRTYGAVDFATGYIAGRTFGGGGGWGGGGGGGSWGGGGGGFSGGGASGSW